jgi:hypothetical protein
LATRTSVSRPTYGEAAIMARTAGLCSGLDVAAGFSSKMAERRPGFVSGAALLAFPFSRHQAADLVQLRSSASCEHALSKAERMPCLVPCPPLHPHRSPERSG